MKIACQNNYQHIFSFDHEKRKVSFYAQYGILLGWLGPFLQNWMPFFAIAQSHSTQK